ncbi:hypothetical protein EMCRGX_G019329 [Ephydatia muelleri]
MSLIWAQVALFHGWRPYSCGYIRTPSENTKMERSIGRINSTAHLPGFAQIITTNRFTVGKFSMHHTLKTIKPQTVSPSDLQTMISFPRALPGSSLVRV